MKKLIVIVVILGVLGYQGSMHVAGNASVSSAKVDLLKIAKDIRPDKSNMKLITNSDDIKEKVKKVLSRWPAISFNADDIKIECIPIRGEVRESFESKNEAIQSQGLAVEMTQGKYNVNKQSVERIIRVNVKVKNGVLDDRRIKLEASYSGPL
ncbi:hypothetical protein JYT61_00570 [bacterium AH-315-E10]|nr:hypothetical protein [bacterium AH-315-E10]